MSQRNTAVTDQLTAPTDASSPEDCPLPEVLALIGDKWSAQVLVQLGEGPHRFTQLERAIEGISRRMLTVSLRNLERNGLITRTVYPDSPPRVEYATTALVEDIRAPLEALAAWARYASPVIAAARHAYDNRH
ncbi:winged helix-turn-helix transcriptional regulator [Nonomuraea muscovyensis]|uniref:DNA-binding HxlR family transcriptional regulator n=1 Tax=Nonomuraea muscovyensis TaxID=1124761 RepID=A0A7X0BX32_9ACTN|nr:helix-turn-helix domain-containing protein [Nonomuraea muscovyensis]MBB6344332.1 DNA-binding HxlR family transcriptional regulator [Nonomuraea muscovyensis]